MSRLSHLTFAFALVLLNSFAAYADDTLAKQRQTADAVSKALQLTAIGNAETKNLIVYGTLSDLRLKALAGTLEKLYTTAFKGLQFDKDDLPWEGKLTVYVFTERGDFRSFLRQVEKRSAEDTELGSVAWKGDAPHAAAGPGRTKDAPSAEVQAGYQLAAALLAVRAKNVPLPEWVMTGFGKATAAQAAGAPAGNRKRAARALVGRIKPTDAWNDSAPAEARQILATSIMDFLVYGKGASKPADFLNGFRPDDEKPMKTGADALAAVKLTPEQFEVAYRKWLASNN